MNFRLAEADTINPKNLGILETISLAFIAACWVSRDSTKSKEPWPTDHVMIFYAVLFPAYIITTRKWKGAALLLKLATALLLTAIIPAFFT
jgi:hypothetical protein